MDVAGRTVAAGRCGSSGGLEVPPLGLEDIAAEATGTRTGVLRDHTSGHPEKRPVHVVSHIRQVQAEAPAFIGWLHPRVIWQPNSWHQPIGRPW
ncbi:MAG TPA: hypothetical protein VM263_04375 [Acidimicrobiales bacterium]|nr:hypothetical protein [Acidimicrobiales bacterium]